MTKHININLNFTREIIESKKIVIKKVGPEDNQSNVFTNSLLEFDQFCQRVIICYRETQVS